MPALFDADGEGDEDEVEHEDGPEDGEVEHFEKRGEERDESAEHEFLPEVELAELAYDGLGAVLALLQLRVWDVVDVLFVLFLVLDGGQGGGRQEEYHVLQDVEAKDVADGEVALEVYHAEEEQAEDSSKGCPAATLVDDERVDVLAEEVAEYSELH